jgi:hypothetical protein
MTICKLQELALIEAASFLEDYFSWPSKKIQQIVGNSYKQKSR